jgi:hypothetical protein
MIEAFGGRITGEIRAEHAVEFGVAAGLGPVRIADESDATVWGKPEEVVAWRLVGSSADEGAIVGWGTGEGVTVAGGLAVGWIWMVVAGGFIGIEG